MIIREAQQTDLKDLLSVHRAAFGSNEEASLVADLLADQSAQPTVSLVAVEGRQIVGHILFTRARLQGDTAPSISLLAPLAVIPLFQNQGIGGKLIEAGIQQLAQTGVDMVFVLGYPNYYGRHGFRPAAVLGLDAPHPIPPQHADAWMLRELRPGIADRSSGTLICADKIADVKYWRE